MDKIPKLRRKPKPPAIETRVERTSTDTSESNISNNASAAGAPILADTPSPRPPSGLSSPRTQSPAGRPATSEGSRRRQQLQQHLQQQPTGKRSPFRGLRLRASAKRARESSPAHSSSPPPTLPPIAHNDAVKMPENTSDDDNDVFMDNRRNDLGPIMPYFLRLADRGML